MARVWPERGRFADDALLVVVTLLAATGWIFSKLAVAEAPPLFFLGVRFVGAAVVLAALRPSDLRSLWSPAGVRAVALGGLLAVAMMIWVVALQTSRHVGTSSFVCSLGAVLVPFLARAVSGEPVPRSTFVALPFAVLGLAGLALDGAVQLDVSQLTMLLAASLFALHFTLIGRASPELPSLALTVVQLLVVGVVAGAASLGFEGRPPPISGTTWLVILGSVLVASCMRFWLQTHVQRRVTASHAAAVMVLEPVWAALLGVAFLGETMTPRQLVGALLVFTALIVQRLPSLRG